MLGMQRQRVSVVGWLSLLLCFLFLHLCSGFFLANVKVGHPGSRTGLCCQAEYPHLGSCISIMNEIM